MVPPSYPQRRCNILGGQFAVYGFLAALQLHKEAKSASNNTERQAGESSDTLAVLSNFILGRVNISDTIAAGIAGLSVLTTAHMMCVFEEGAVFLFLHCAIATAGTLVGVVGGTLVGKLDDADFVHTMKNFNADFINAAKRDKWFIVLVNAFFVTAFFVSGLYETDCMVDDFSDDARSTPRLESVGHQA
jgi:hypothetical protein